MLIKTCETPFIWDPGLDPGCRGLFRRCPDHRDRGREDCRGRRDRCRRAGDYGLGPVPDAAADAERAAHSETARNLDIGSVCNGDLHSASNGRPNDLDRSAHGCSHASWHRPHRSECRRGDCRHWQAQCPERLRVREPQQRLERDGDGKEWCLSCSSPGKTWKRSLKKTFVPGNYLIPRESKSA